MRENTGSSRNSRRDILRVGGAISVGGFLALAGCSTDNEGTPEEETPEEDTPEETTEEDTPEDTPKEGTPEEDTPEDTPEEETPEDDSDDESVTPVNYIFTTENELARIRERAQQQPWASARDRLMSNAEDAVNAGNVTYDSSDERGNAPRARKIIRDAALGYYFSGEDRFAESTIDKLHHFFINDSTSYQPTDPVIPHARIINSIVIPGLLFSASIVRDHPYWSEKGGEDQMQNWCRTYIETCKQYSRETYGDERTLYKHPQNRFEYRIVDRLANAAYLKDDQLFDETVELWKDFHNAEVPFPENEANLAVFPNGRRNDAHRDEGWEYARYGLDACVSCAEIARHKGYDLYTWQDTPASSKIADEAHRGTREGPLIPRQFRWLNNIFFNPGEWEWDYVTRPATVEPTARGVVAYEYGSSFFRGTGLGDEIDRVLDTFFDRPAFNRKNTGHVTLTHGNPL